MSRIFLDFKVVAATAGSFQETRSQNKDNPKTVSDLESDSHFPSDLRCPSEDIPHKKNNWVCYDLKERRIVQSQDTIRWTDNSRGKRHLKSWLIETSADGESWREVSRRENNERLNGRHFTGTFAVAGGGECRFIRLVNISRNHWGWDQLRISAWEIFGGLAE
jgi:hypothetical protein